MYVSSKQMLIDAVNGGYAVGAFNVENMEMIQAVVVAAEELSAPVIIQTTPGSVRFAGLEFFVCNAITAAKNAKVPVCLHLDHGESYDLCERALISGYNSIMIDGSKLPFEENARLTEKTVKKAAELGVPVEAELGRLGGKEDDLAVSGKNFAYTDPAEAAEFAALTGISSLAVAVGTAHGIYSDTPVLDIGRISLIREAVAGLPIVLHGASGLDGATVKKCIKNGINKINYATELRQAFSEAVKAVIAAKPGLYDPKEFLIPARESVRNLVKEKIILCGCAGKA